MFVCRAKRLVATKCNNPVFYVDEPRKTFDPELKTRRRKIPFSPNNTEFKTFRLRRRDCGRKRMYATPAKNTKNGMKRRKRRKRKCFSVRGGYA